MFHSFLLSTHSFWSYQIFPCSHYQTLSYCDYPCSDNQFVSCISYRTCFYFFSCCDFFLHAIHHHLQTRTSVTSGGASASSPVSFYHDAGMSYCWRLPPIRPPRPLPRLCVCDDASFSTSLGNWWLLASLWTGHWERQISVWKMFLSLDLIPQRGWVSTFSFHWLGGSLS